MLNESEKTNLIQARNASIHLVEILCDLAQCNHVLLMDIGQDLLQQAQEIEMRLKRISLLTETV